MRRCGSPALTAGVQEWLDLNDLIQTHGKHWLWRTWWFIPPIDRATWLWLRIFTRIARPDMNVEFRERADWFEKEGTGVILRHHRVLKPGWAASWSARTRPGGSPRRIWSRAGCG